MPILAEIALNCFTNGNQMPYVANEEVFPLISNNQSCALIISQLNTSLPNFI